MVNDLSSEELLSIVEKYSWFSPARAILCRKALESSGLEAAMSAFKDSLLYFPEPEYLAGKLFRASDSVFKDADRTEVYSQARPKIILAGADYFSKEDYDSVRDSSMENMGRLVRTLDDDISEGDRGENSAENGAYEISGGSAFADLVTETLGHIYAEQGYFKEAKEIYSKLSLQNPGKSAYFASLIDNLGDNLNS